MNKFIIKRIKHVTPYTPKKTPNVVVNNTTTEEIVVEPTVTKELKATESNVMLENKNAKELNEMTTAEKIQQVSEMVTPAPKVKRTKKDKGLIERTESSTIILTEDNKELLHD